MQFSDEQEKISVDFHCVSAYFTEICRRSDLAVHVSSEKIYLGHVRYCRCNSVLMRVFIQQWLACPPDDPGCKKKKSSIEAAAVSAAAAAAQQRRA